MSSEVSVGRGLAMHVKITATQRESVRDNIKRRIELEEEGGGAVRLFSFVSRGDGDGLCKRRVETGVSRDDRVCDWQRNGKERGTLIKGRRED
jgi:hypothetical protein